MEVPALLTALRELEIALHQPEVRSDPVKLGALLHPRFREFGRSGAEYTRAGVLGEFQASPQSYQVWSQDFQVEELAPGTALLTYRSAHIGAGGVLERHTMRASVRQLTPSGWKMRFHQGTPTGEFEKHAT
jgi:hypothetical protein